MKDFFDLILFEQHLKDKKNLSEGSIHTYTRTVERFLLTNPNLEELEAYNDFIIKYAIKKRCLHYASALKEFIRFKIEDVSIKTYLLNNLIKPPPKYDIKQERKYLEEDKILEVINYLENYKHRVIALIQCLTGVRAGDVFSLRKGSIMPELYENKPVLKLAIIGKGKKRNVVFLHDEIAQHFVLDFINNNFCFDDYYFLELGKMKNRQGNPNNEYLLKKMNYLWYWKDLKQALQMAGIDRQNWATHDFRRAFARRCWTRFKDIHVLQNLLNHRDPKTTLRYLEQSGLKNIEYHRMMQEK